MHYNSSINNSGIPKCLLVGFPSLLKSNRQIILERRFWGRYFKRRFWGGYLRWKLWGPGICRINYCWDWYVFGHQPAPYPKKRHAIHTVRALVRTKDTPSITAEQHRQHTPKQPHIERHEQWYEPLPFTALTPDTITTSDEGPDCFPRRRLTPQPSWCLVPFFSFSPSHLLSTPFFSLSLLVITQIRGHMAGSSPPSPLWFVPCIFVAPFFLVDLRLPTHARRRSRHLFNRFFLRIANKFTIPCMVGFEIQDQRYSFGSLASI